jgi:hypothetical protein
VIDPPNLTDFDGGYTAWQQKKAMLASQANATAKGKAKSPTPPPKKEQSKKEESRKNESSKKDNPYARPFGRLTVNELEKQISETETAAGNLQRKLSDPAIARDPGKVRNFKNEHDALAAKLDALEAEYYARGK